MTAILRKAEEALRAAALALPEAYEEFPWGERALKVRGKIFVTIVCDNGTLSLSMKLPESSKAVLERPFCDADGLRAGQKRLGHHSLRPARQAADGGPAPLDRGKLPGRRAETPGGRRVKAAARVLQARSDGPRRVRGFLVFWTAWLTAPPFDPARRRGARPPARPDLPTTPPSGLARRRALWRCRCRRRPTDLRRRASTSRRDDDSRHAQRAPGKRPGPRRTCAAHPTDAARARTDRQLLAPRRAGTCTSRSRTPSASCAASCGAAVPCGCVSPPKPAWR